MISDIENIYNFVNIVEVSKDMFLEGEIAENENERIENIALTSGIDNITNMTFENVQSTKTNITANLFRERIVFEKRANNNDFTLIGSNISKILELYRENESSFIQESFFYPEIHLDPEFAKRNNTVSEEFSFVASDSSAYVAFVENNLKNYKYNLSIRTMDNKIVANIVDREIHFKRFDNNYYSLILSLLEPTNSLGESVSDRNRSLMVKNIVVRICIIFNINRKLYTILKNIKISPSGDLLQYVRNNSYNLTENNMNIDFLNLETNFYMPSFSYRGMIQ